MIRGLEIRMAGEDLAGRIAERVRAHETEKAALEERIKRREGDMPYDFRVGDGLETLGELQSRRAFHAERATQLNLIRTHLIGDETYTLNLADLRGADLVAPDAGGGDAHDGFIVESRRPTLGSSSEARTIQGLTLTMPGVELQDLLKDRIRSHHDCEGRWKRELARTSADETEDEPLLPSHICENEAERHEWRAEVLGFIHDHIEPAETYRLGEADLAFGELLPAKPGWLEQDEYEERRAVGFQLERLVKRGGLAGLGS
jgi:hypothetical protein